MTKQRQHPRRYQSGKIRIINKGFKTKKMDSAWKRRLTIHNKEYLKDAKLRKLNIKLLSFGGEKVALCLEGDIDKILSRGRLIDGKQSYMMKKQSIRCHANSAELWSQNKARTTIFTGWALSDDGAWRQHTWLRDNFRGKIVETTEKRVAYFGFPLNKQESETFYEENW